MGWIDNILYIANWNAHHTTMTSEQLIAAKSSSMVLIANMLDGITPVTVSNGGVSPTASVNGVNYTTLATADVATGITFYDGIQSVDAQMQSAIFIGEVTHMTGWGDLPLAIAAGFEGTDAHEASAYYHNSLYEHCK